MSTWHQDKAGISAAYTRHATQWKLVENPPNGMCTVSTYNTLADAEAYIDRRVNQFKNGRRESFSVVAPLSVVPPWGMKEPDKYLPMNRAELIARCEAQEAALRDLVPYAEYLAGTNYQAEVIKNARELLK